MPRTVANDYIKINEDVAVIYTDGTLLEFGDDNTALTGDWKIDIKRPIDRIIIYVREPSANSLYIGNYAGREFVEEKVRYKIQLTHVQYIGKTDLNWHEFAHTGAYPVRYIFEPELIAQ